MASVDSPSSQASSSRNPPRPTRNTRGRRPKSSKEDQPVMEISKQPSQNSLVPDGSQPGTPPPSSSLTEIKLSPSALGDFLDPNYVYNIAGAASSEDYAFKCPGPGCNKIYRGRHARSIWRRHLQDKHGLRLADQARRSRWDKDREINKVASASARAASAPCVKKRKTTKGASSAQDTEGEDEDELKDQPPPPPPAKKSPKGKQKPKPKPPVKAKKGKSKKSTSPNTRQTVGPLGSPIQQIRRSPRYRTQPQPQSPTLRESKLEEGSSDESDEEPFDPRSPIQTNTNRPFTSFRSAMAGRNDGFTHVLSHSSSSESPSQLAPALPINEVDLVIDRPFKPLVTREFFVVNSPDPSKEENLEDTAVHTLMAIKNSPGIRSPNNGFPPQTQERQYRPLKYVPQSDSEDESLEFQNRNGRVNSVPLPRTEPRDSVSSWRRNDGDPFASLRTPGRDVFSSGSHIATSSVRRAISYKEHEVSSGGRSLESQTGLTSDFSGLGFTSPLPNVSEREGYLMIPSTFDSPVYPLNTPGGQQQMSNFRYAPIGLSSPPNGATSFSSPAHQLYSVQLGLTYEPGPGVLASLDDTAATPISNERENPMSPSLNKRKREEETSRATEDVFAS